MKTVNVYQIQEIFFNRTLGRLVSKAFYMNQNLGIMCSNDEQVDGIDRVLWTFSQISFLPHYTDKYPVINPKTKSVYIGTKYKEMEGSSYIFMSPEIVKNIGDKIYVIDTKHRDKKNLTSILNNFALKVFFQNSLGKWSLIP